ncbi:MULTISPECIES: glycosyltransferase family 2 protein [unclassified Paraburkholderia]|uniref:glycosyltransferase family 2 protein n=1 Tax=unclassified Paraburkholderia TaxID=2615204 RepID=UPI0018572303|nr:MULTISPECIES: glycosyltransferase family 2 protein [unclassified Paraburkholderia]MBB5411233.1 cellulose synthase/poly-beta-1,6-N-acetylglucosamine synthase-like glycosyltransferase [Paraburkholderia sp. HC6.4b]MBB5454005.1 cellulose synthase/poly-beta-1,6-N-acetylglucosamine synthase-like glycosyltransferase [Paraburkholderia sp. Kb1A]
MAQLALSLSRLMRSAVLLLLDQYETQIFRGKPSDFGEDRHLTILVLTAGYRTEYVPDAIAATVVPDRLGVYLRQQLRWARSTYRDTLLSLRLLPCLDRYLTLDVIGQNLGSLFLALSLLAGARAARIDSDSAVVDCPDNRIIDHDPL